ncbi:hypothetical protein P3T20_001064 [Paraburkholderia sp. GAS206C]|jgi:hypothetical protein|uniref:hypothetical protein n=1 Tax=unclassified Paraburkholderia TaxID=2615204 RepID=UPI003D194C0A
MFRPDPNQVALEQTGRKEMEQFFMRRGSAVTYLLARRRAWFAAIADTSRGNIEMESREIEQIERLILDVRAGRVRAFELTRPKRVAIFVTD